jgi:hypothetical protein
LASRFTVLLKARRHSPRQFHNKILLEKRNLILCILLAAAILPYWIGVGDSTLWDANEAFYAETPRVMIETRDYVSPSFNAQPRFNKPPLTYWIVAASYRAFGVSEWSERLPIVLAAMGLIAAAFVIGRVVWGTQGGPVGGDRNGDAATPSDAFTAHVDRRFPHALHGSDTDVFCLERSSARTEKALAMPDVLVRRARFYDERPGRGGPARRGVLRIPPHRTATSRYRQDDDPGRHRDLSGDRRTVVPACLSKARRQLHHLVHP